jgi:hypothetical protein
MRLEIETVGVPVCPHAPEAPMSAAAAWRRFQRHYDEKGYTIFAQVDGRRLAFQGTAGHGPR